MIVEFLNARVRGIGRIESALFVDADAQRPGKMPLSGAAPGLEKCSIGKEDMDAALLRVSDINGAAGIHRDSRGVAHTRVLERKQGSAIRFKFVDKIGGRVGEENIAQRIGREGHWRVEFAGAFAFISPGAEEFKGRRRLRFRRRVRAISARNEEKYARRARPREVSIASDRNFIRHAAKLQLEIV